MTTKTTDMKAVAKDIIMMKISRDDTVKQLETKFFKIMRKHGIKKGTRTGPNTITGNNFDWTMAHVLFRTRISCHFEHSLIFGQTRIPKDLEC